MSEEKVNRRMIFPYTLSAKVAQFPYKFYYNNERAWMFKWCIFGFIAAAPIFYQIQKLSFSPGNVKKWDEIRRKQFSGEREH
ncbi:reduction of Rh1 [Megalopta genalis]|uniref:reduction of Rh1 n=1 Tax=Megalopta genalis TaxID=115081 RepID=UPI003FD6B2CF